MKDVMRYEVEKDYPSRFIGQSWDEDPGFGLHFHRNLEIYGVVHGTVTATIAGEKKLLTDGHIAISDCMEGHSFLMEEGKTAHVWYLHIGTKYLETFRSVYGNSKLPRFILDSDYNDKVIYPRIAPFLNKIDVLPELRCYGISCEIIADIVDRYGVVDKPLNKADQCFVEEVIQYIFDHLNENITLKSLANIFFTTPTKLSRKLHESLGVDFREFINNIRFQKVETMLADSGNKSMSLKEIVALCGFNYMETYYRCKKRNRNTIPPPK